MVLDTRALVGQIYVPILRAAYCAVCPLKSGKWDRRWRCIEHGACIPGAFCMCAAMVVRKFIVLHIAHFGAL